MMRALMLLMKRMILRKVMAMHLTTTTKMLQIPLLLVQNKQRGRL